MTSLRCIHHTNWPVGGGTPDVPQIEDFLDPETRNNTGALQSVQEGTPAHYYLLNAVTDILHQSMWSHTRDPYLH